MRLTSGMFFSTASASLSTALSSLSSPSIIDYKHKMKGKINHALSRKEERKYKKYFDLYRKWIDVGQDMAIFENCFQISHQLHTSPFKAHLSSMSDRERVRER